MAVLRPLQGSPEDSLETTLLHCSGAASGLGSPLAPEAKGRRAKGRPRRQKSRRLPGGGGFGAEYGEKSRGRPGGPWVGQRFQAGKWLILRCHSQKGLETNLGNSSSYTGETEAVRVGGTRPRLRSGWGAEAS